MGDGVGASTFRGVSEFTSFFKDHQEHSGETLMYWRHTFWHPVLSFAGNILTLLVLMDSQGAHIYEMLSFSNPWLHYLEGEVTSMVSRSSQMSTDTTATQTLKPWQIFSDLQLPADNVTLVITDKIPLKEAPSKSSFTHFSGPGRKDGSSHALKVSRFGLLWTK